MAMFLSVVAGEKTTPNIFPARKAVDACREVLGGARVRRCHRGLLH